MTNILSLPLQTVEKIDDVKPTENAEQQLSSVMIAHKQWRSNKKHVSEPMPDALCQQIFGADQFKVTPSSLQTTHF